MRLERLLELEAKLDGFLTNLGRGDQVAKLVGRKTSLPTFPRGKSAAADLAHKANDLRNLKKGRMRFGNRVLRENEVLPSAMEYAKKSGVRDIKRAIASHASLTRRGA